MKSAILPILVLCGLCLVSGASWAEYRVYKLGITYGPKAPEVMVLSSLDDLQYNSYYRITPNQRVRLVDHWMCRGRTDGFKKYCSKPYKSPIQQSQAAAPQQPVPNVIQ